MWEGEIKSSSSNCDRTNEDCHNLKVYKLMGKVIKWNKCLPAVNNDGQVDKCIVFSKKLKK